MWLPFACGCVANHCGHHWARLLACGFPSNKVLRIASAYRTHSLSPTPQSTVRLFTELFKAICHGRLRGECIPQVLLLHSAKMAPIFQDMLVLNPGDSSLRVNTVLPPSPLSLNPSDLNTSRDDEEQSVLQEHWDKSIAKHMNLPDGYQNVYVLMIKWADAIDQLGVREEVLSCYTALNSQYSRSRRSTSLRTFSETSSNTM